MVTGKKDNLLLLYLVLPNLGGGHALNNGAAGLPGVHNPGPAGHLHHGDGLPGLQQGGGLSVLPGLDTGKFTKLNNCNSLRKIISSFLFHLSIFTTIKNQQEFQ